MIFYIKQLFYFPINPIIIFYVKVQNKESSGRWDLRGSLLGGQPFSGNRGNQEDEGKVHRHGTGSCPQGDKVPAKIRSSEYHQTQISYSSKLGTLFGLRLPRNKLTASLHQSPGIGPQVDRVLNQKHLFQDDAGPGLPPPQWLLPPGSKGRKHPLPQSRSQNL